MLTGSNTGAGELASPVEIDSKIKFASSPSTGEGKEPGKEPGGAGWEAVRRFGLMLSKKGRTSDRERTSWLSSVKIKNVRASPTFSEIPTKWPDRSRESGKRCS